MIRRILRAFRPAPRPTVADALRRQRERAVIEAARAYVDQKERGVYSWDELDPLVAAVREYERGGGPPTITIPCNRPGKMLVHFVYDGRVSDVEIPDPCAGDLFRSCALALNYGLAIGAEKRPGGHVWDRLTVEEHMLRGARHALSARLGEDSEDHLRLAICRFLMALAVRDREARVT